MREEDRLPDSLKNSQANGYRVLYVRDRSKSAIERRKPAFVEPVALFEIDDPIRKNAQETLSFIFGEEGVI